MKTVQLTNEQYEALMQGQSITIEPPKPMKWEPKEGLYEIYGSGEVLKQISTSKKYTAFGSSRQTREAAEKARDAMRSHNRLLAWLAENDDGWVADWGNFNQSKYYVYFCHRTTRWLPDYDKSIQIQSVVYMSQLNVHKLCKLLNDGVVEL